MIGKVESLWRYPVKSMRGENLSEAFLGFAGVYGDRLYAFRNPAQPPGFPFQTGREEARMLLHSPRFRHPDKAALPINLAEAQALAPGLTPLSADPADLAVDVETPTGETLAIDDPALARSLGEGAASLSLMRSDRSITDCRPVSLFALQTARQLGEEVGTVLDKRRFRANIYVELDESPGFAEDNFVGRRLQIGAKAVVAVLERDPRCKMITLDPDTGEANPDILRKVARAHGGMAGLYGAVLIEGVVRPGDDIALLD